MINLHEILSIAAVHAVYGKKIFKLCCGRAMKRTARMSRTQFIPCQHQPIPTEAHWLIGERLCAARHAYGPQHACHAVHAAGHAPLGPLSLNVIDQLKRSFVVAGICAGPPDACHALHAGHTLHALHAGHTLHALHATQAGHTLHALHAGHTARNAHGPRTNCVALHAGRALHSERTVKTGCPQVTHGPHPQRMAGNVPRQCTHVTHCTHCTHYTHVTQLVMCIIICAVNDNIYLSVSKVTFTVVDECTYQLTVPQRSEMALLPKQ